MRDDGPIAVDFYGEVSQSPRLCGQADASGSESKVMRFGIRLRTSLMLSTEEPTGISNITKIVMTIGKAEVIRTARSRRFFGLGADE